MTLSTLPGLSNAPTRKNMKDFDDKGDAFLSSLEIWSLMLIAWIDEFNAESATWDQKFYNSDSRLATAIAEIQAARSGSDTLKDRLDALAAQTGNLVVMQQTLSLSQVSVTMARRPTPDDAGYVPGTYWIYPAEDDFWFCVRTVNRLTRWRRSNGDLIRRLEAPTVNGDTSIDTAGNLTITLTGLDPEALEVRWTATGSPTVISGAMSGTLGTTITLAWPDAGNYEVRAKVYGNNVLLYDSLYSDALPVNVGPSIYCGSGAYCGDGSYCGMMLS